MRKILLIVVSLLLVGCSLNDKTRGLLMRINLDSNENVVWRCQSNNDEVIKVTEENFIGSAPDGLAGQYQFKFVGVAAGEATITCNYLEVDNDIEEINTIYVEVDGNKFIRYLRKEGSKIAELSDPVFG